MRCRDRKNRGAPPTPSIDMRNQIKARSPREIPAVSRVLEALGDHDLPRVVIVDVIRRQLSEMRAGGKIFDFGSIIQHLRRSLDQLRASRLQPIINGTGIVLHTKQFARSTKSVPIILTSNTTLKRASAVTAVLISRMLWRCFAGQKQ